jgi:hypothetical protein
MPASGHSLRSYSASGRPFVRCWPDGVLDFAAQRMPRSAISDVTLFSARLSLTYNFREPPAGRAEIPPINGGLCAHGGA